MSNYSHERPHLYISKAYKCPATVKGVRVPPECFEHIAKAMAERGFKTFSEYIRFLIYRDMENDREIRD